jgi:hypothetical protein
MRMEDNRNFVDLSMYSVYDKELNVFNTPFFARSDIEAKRTFIQAIEDPKSVINRFSDKFALYEVGMFIQADGNLISVSPPVKVMEANSIKKKGSKNDI